MKKYITILFSLLLSSTAFSQFTMTWGPITAGQTITIPTNGGGYNYDVDWGDLNTSTGITGDATHTYTTAAASYTITITGNFPQLFFNNTGDKDLLLSIDNWGTNPFRSMARAFYGCTNLTSVPASSPNFTAGFSNMANAFRDCSSFNGDLSAWVVSNVTNMAGAFRGCSSFNGDLSSWDVSNVTNMNNLFNGAAVFNGNLSSWDVSNVANMNNLFRGATVFNGDLSSWTTTSLTSMALIFRDAAAFNSDLTNFDVSNVTTMAGAFNGATAFNGNISSFAPSASLTTIAQMFRSAAAFNQDISSWNTSGVTNMNSVFLNATAFDQNLGSLDLSNNPTMANFLNNSGMSVANYDATLNGWNANPATPDGISVGVNNLVYCNAGDAARINLETATPAGKGWTFNGHSACATLPVELIDFKANKIKEIIQLDWQTATEINNDFFSIERSSDGKNWETIIEIKGAGNSNETLSYTVNDLNPLNGLGYYRLKQTDFDGQYSYSNTINVNLRRNTEQLNIVVSPNPVENIINIEVNSETLTTIKIYNAIGKEVTEIVNFTSISENKAQFDLSNLPNGIYYLKAKDFSTKFLKGKK